MKLHISDKSKLKLITSILENIEDQLQTDFPTYKMIGTLTKEIKIGGCYPNPIGSPVFETNDRYFLLFTTLDGKKNIEVKYYKESSDPFISQYLLKEYINFEGACIIP
jgi:hypothetical protein